VVTRKGRLLGRLSNGLESDKGRYIHAVRLSPATRPPCPYNDFGRKEIPNDNYTTWKSLCGKVAGKKSVGWDFDDSQEVTCPQCIKKK